MKTQSLFFRSASVWLDTGATAGGEEMILATPCNSGTKHEMCRSKAGRYLLVWEYLNQGTRRSSRCRRCFWSRWEWQQVSLWRKGQWGYRGKLQKPPKWKFRTENFNQTADLYSLWYLVFWFNSSFRLKPFLWGWKQHGEKPQQEKKHGKTGFIKTKCL